jgi:preprotein translocase subunit SecG
MLQLLHTPIVILHAIVCILLMLVVLIQPGKSGGLGAALGGAGAQQIFGGRGAGNFLTRTTWISATVFFVTSITLAYISTSTGDSLQNLNRRNKAQGIETSSAPDTAKGDSAAAPPADKTAPAPSAPSPAAPATDSNSAPAAPAAPAPSAPAQP